LKLFGRDRENHIKEFREGMRPKNCEHPKKKRMDLRRGISRNKLGLDEQGNRKLKTCGKKKLE